LSNGCLSISPNRMIRTIRPFGRRYRLRKDQFWLPSLKILTASRFPETFNFAIKVCHHRPPEISQEYNMKRFLKFAFDSPTGNLENCITKFEFDNLFFA
jgi:hypothetical protein